MYFKCNLDRLLRPMGTEHSLFMHQESGTKYPMKFESLTPSQVLKDHLRRSCLLNLVITDNYFCRFVYMVLVLIFPFFDHCKYNMIWLQNL